MLQIKVLEEIKRHILCSVTFFENHAVYDTLWKNTVERVSPHTTVWRMRITYWIPKATHTNTQAEYVVLIAFPLQQ